MSIVFCDSVIYLSAMRTETYISNLLGTFATNIVTRVEQEIADLGGRSITHESALVTIRNHPGESIDVLSKALGLTHSGAVRLINSLETEAFVERHRSIDDKRSVEINLTPKGQKRAIKVLEARERVTNTTLKMLSQDQQAALVPVLEAALAGLTNNQESARRICRLCDESVCRSQGCPVENAAKCRQANFVANERI